jgi:hypothetical protein
MKEKMSLDELRSLYNAFEEKAEILDEIKGIKEIFNEIKDILSDLRDENSYKNNYLMVRLKKETSIGYQAIERLIGMNLIHYDGNKFDFTCERIGVIGSFFAYVKFKKPKLLPDYVTHKGNPVAPIVFTNGGKITSTNEWKIIEKILNNLNLTQK